MENKKDILVQELDDEAIETVTGGTQVMIEGQDPGDVRNLPGANK